MFFFLAASIGWKWRFSWWWAARAVKKILLGMSKRVCKQSLFEYIFSPYLSTLFVTICVLF